MAVFAPSETRTISPLPSVLAGTPSSPYWFTREKRGQRGVKLKKGEWGNQYLTSLGNDLTLVSGSDGRGDGRGGEEEGDHGGELHFDGFDFYFFILRKREMCV